MNKSKFNKAKTMNIHDKINIRNNPLNFLEFSQYMQLMNKDLLSLAPYYYDRLRRQNKQVQEAESFKSIFGKFKYEYENNI